MGTFTDLDLTRESKELTDIRSDLRVVTGGINVTYQWILVAILPRRARWIARPTHGLLLDPPTVRISGFVLRKKPGKSTGP
jgi:hypothetical protein